MSLKLYYHPLSSFCHKAMIAFYENDIPFEPVQVDLTDEQSSAEMRSLWPLGKFPVLRDELREHTVAESTVIIEYLDLHYAGDRKMLPADPDLAWQARMWDRFYDSYVHLQLQAIVFNGFRPEEFRDPFGVERAEAMLRKAYAILEQRMAESPRARNWGMGDEYGLVDCAASPALFYANCAVPIDGSTPHLAAYLDRLTARPSYAKALREAEPYFHWVPLETKPKLPPQCAEAGSASQAAHSG